MSRPLDAADPSGVTVTVAARPGATGAVYRAAAGGGSPGSRGSRVNHDAREPRGRGEQSDEQNQDHERDADELDEHGVVGR